MTRIETLRNEALNNTICYDEFFCSFYKYLGDSEELPIYEKYGDAFYYAMSNMTPSISEGELIVGKCNLQISDSDTEWHEKYCKIAENMIYKAGLGQDSHMAIDYELLLKFGVNGIIRRIESLSANCEESKKPFYKSCIRCLEGVNKFSENYSVYALKLAKHEINPERKRELEKISEICKKVPANPPESFYEAVQSVHFITLCLSCNPFRFHIMQQFQLGHPDRYLLPFYEKDLASGNITKEKAQLLLDCLGIQINNRVPNGLSCGYMVGGKDEKGNVTANDLTEMLMNVIDDIRLVYPSVGLCYSECMNDSYLERACEILSHGRSHPAIFGDDTITKGLTGYGVDKVRARNYIHSTCVEITPVGASNVWVASPYTNMPYLLLEILDREYTGFEELLKRLFENLDERIKNNFETFTNTRKQRFENSMNPLLSCFVDDCLEKGEDIEKGGAKYNWIMPSFVGVANLVDSLWAIKTIVFENREMTIADFKKILDENFENNEAFRLRLLNKLAKYGNDNDEIDSYFGMITDHIVNECKKYNGFLENSQLVPSVFCWVMHEYFGKETGATPDGRKAGFPLGDGSGPCQGREMKGPTASIISSTKWNHSELIGGVAVNMKFSKKSLGENSICTMKNLIKTYIKRGGFEIQINVTDKETLEEAVKYPEKYRDLVVRIGGYSDYFVKLTPEMQQEVILRTEHSLNN